MGTTSEVRFDQRAVLVTGAGRGMGRTHALAIARRGASVLVADRGVSLDGTGVDRGPAEATVAEIRGNGGVAASYDGDLSTYEGALGAVEATIEEFGRIDGIVHNASTGPEVTPIDQMATAAIERTLRVNSHAAFHMIRAAWPAFLRQEFGRIVLVSSHAIYGTGQCTAYATAKSSYIGLVRSLALEAESQNVLVNCLAPTAWTRMIDRMAPSAYADWVRDAMRPEYVSSAVAYLVSEQCSVSGQVFSVSGGRIARILLAESEGVRGLGESPESVGAAITAVMGDKNLFVPTSSADRALKVAADMGYVELRQ